MSKKQDKIFIIIISIILMGVLLWFPIKHILISKGYLELFITNNWVFYESNQTSFLGKIDDFIEGKKTSLQNRITNYFPFYNNLNHSFYNGIIKLNGLIYKDELPINVNASNEYIFYNNEFDFYYVRNNHNRDDLYNRTLLQIDLFNSIYESNKDINLNIYIVPRYEQTKFAKHNLSNYTNIFKEGLNNNINVSELKIESTKDYTEKFYKTDHHWNMYGAYQGYKDITAMLGKTPLELEINQVSERPYYGSFASRSLSQLTKDYIIDVNADLKYETSISGYENIADFKPRKITYNKGNEFLDYYIHYFDGQYGLVKYTYDNNSNENLLIFCDSYAWQIDYLIASHYKNTYVINLRYDEFANGKVNYNKFIKENNITDVLFLYEGSATIFDQYNYNFNKKIVRDN